MICIILSAILAVALLAGCSRQSGGNEEEKSTKIKIIATIFPEYDWVRNILGEREDDVELILLMDNGADLHNYQLTADDILDMSDCDLFICVGGESDERIMDAFEKNRKETAIEINLMEVLGDHIKEEETVEGMEEEDEHDHDHDEEETEYDEHVWLSLDNAEEACEAIADALIKADPENREIYLSNLERYKTKLDELDDRYEAVISASPVRMLVFRDRFPFRYLVDDYGLSYYAAFAGCSAETEASFETVIFLAETVDRNELGCIMKIESSDGRIAAAVRENTADKDQEILTLDSMQSKTMKDVMNGDTYLDTMEGNLEVLRKALSK